MDVADGRQRAEARSTGLVSGQFGTVPGHVPAHLHEAYARSSGPDRGRAAVELARCWAYGGEPARAVRFADEAVAIAEAVDDPSLLTAALDAQLLVHWGPDDLDQRLRITRRLEDTAAHLSDLEARLAAHLWPITVALEHLDLPAVRRQLRALDLLAEESGSARVAFFTASRRGMVALLEGDLEAASEARAAAVAAGTRADEPDVTAVEHELAAGIARQRGDVAALGREAAMFEEFGTTEGIRAITAEGAVLWLAAGRSERAARLLHQVSGPGLGSLPRDVFWLMAVCHLTEVAAAVGAAALVEEAIVLLEPYAGRGVVNAGGVTFGGVVDDYLALAGRALGREAAADNARRMAEAAYRRMGATWWLHRVAGRPTSLRPTEVLHLHPVRPGVWRVGPAPTDGLVPDVRGLHYLRILLQRPGAEVSALELSAAAGQAGSPVPDADLGPTLDRAALSSYRRRLAELDTEIEELRSWHDEARIDRLEDEREAIRSELSGALGLGGRLRRTGGTAERARVAVQKAIAAAVRRIEQVDPATARLIRDTVTTGRFCRYDPDPSRPVRWVLDAPPDPSAV